MPKWAGLISSTGYNGGIGDGEMESWDSPRELGTMVSCKGGTKSRTMVEQCR